MLEPAELEQLNHQIATTKVANVSGEIIERPLEEGLITENGQTIYRVTANIPYMIQRPVNLLWITCPNCRYKMLQNYDLSNRYNEPVNWLV